MSTKQQVTAGLVAVILVMALSCGRTADSALTLPVEEREVTGQQLVHAPEDSLSVGLNPPGFTWTAHERAGSYRFNLYKGEPGGAVLVRLDSLASTVAALNKTLSPGSYGWVVVYRDSSGNDFARSNARVFNVRPGLPEQPLPDIAVLGAKLKNVHPRLFLTPETLSNIRSAVKNGGFGAWEMTLALADAALKEPSYDEPSPYRDGVFEVGEWRRIYTPGKRGSAHAARLALVWQVTGERKYLDGAKRWLLNLSEWDPRGITSFRIPQAGGSEGNTEAAMPMLERMAMAYDWIRDELSPDEREIILGAIRERCIVQLDRYRRIDFLGNPWPNHDGRMMAFFGLAALATLGDFPEAEDCMEYALTSYLTSYPSWGGDDGGWSQGLSYWSAYVYWLTEFAEALRQVSDVDIYRKPFFANTGYFALYCQPPYARRGGFGDGGEGGPGLNQKLLIQKLAVAFRDPVLHWHSSHIRADTILNAQSVLAADSLDWREWSMEDVTAVLNAVPADLGIEPPTGLPPMRWFRDIGWVAMHSALGEPDTDVWALFKAGRFGSISHSHGDQTSFQLNAWGEPLIIDSGYYPWYGSPHHQLWYRQTRAHNTILINGRGQAIQSMSANGRIEYAWSEGKLQAARAEAARAWNIPLEDEVRALWREHLSVPIPPDEPKARTVRRVFAFVADRERPWAAVQDYVETESPASFDWLLHSLEQMETDRAAGLVRVRQGDVRLDVYLISDRPLDFSLTDQFNVPPEERMEGAPNQWHFSASTDSVARARFLAVFVPFRSGESPPAVERIEEDGKRGFRVGGEKVLAWWGDTESGDFTAQGMEGEGRLYLELIEDGQAVGRLCP